MFLGLTRNASGTMADCPSLAQSRASEPVVPQLKRENGQRKGQRHGIGQNDWKRVNKDSIEEPEQLAHGEDQEHGEGNIACGLAPVDAQQLRNKRDGGAYGGAGADKVDDPEWKHSDLILR